MNEHVSAAARPIMVTGPDGQPRPLRFDPDGASIGPEVPEDLIARWKGMLANCGAAQARMHKNYERLFKEQEAYIAVAVRLLNDASGIADDICDLADLFAKVVEEEGVDGKLAEALRLVIDNILSMADRLGALEEQSEAARTRYRV